LEVGAATTRQVNSTADDAAALEPELEPDSEIPSCSFGGSKEADDAVEGLLRQDGFFTLFTDNTTAPGKLLLAIPEAEIDQPFILNSLR
jgi:hypothetical protein